MIALGARRSVPWLLHVALGAVLGVGSVSALGAASGAGAPWLAAPATLGVFVGYGVLSAVLAGVVALAALAAVAWRRRDAPATRAAEPRRVVPAAAFVAGAGTGLHAGTYAWLAGVQWGLGPHPAHAQVVVAWAASDWVFLPVAVVAAAAGARSVPGRAASLALLVLGYGLGHGVARGATSRLFGVEPDGVSWPWVCGLAVVACLVPWDARHSGLHSR